MSVMTAEQSEQRQALIDLGLLPKVVDTFEPHEFAGLLQDMLVEDLFPEDDDEDDE